MLNRRKDPEPLEKQRCFFKALLEQMFLLREVRDLTIPLKITLVGWVLQKVLTKHLFLLILIRFKTRFLRFTLKLGSI